MEPNLTSTMGNVSQYVPPKMWKDLSTDEKLERIREQVKSFQSQLISERGRVNNLENELKNHDHLNGKVVKGININSSTSGGIKALYNPEGEAKGEVYF